MNTVKSKTDTVHEHYSRLAERYDDYLHYSDDFIRALTSKMIEKLELEEGDRLVDLGCGTGMYSLDILAQVALTNPVIGVDPFPQMLAKIPEEAPMTRVALDALVFSARDGAYDKILMKEAVHHVDDKALLFSNLFQRLSAHGRLLLVHVPPKVVYPLFDKALQRALGWHADPDELVTLLQRTGFHVERDGLDYQHSIPKHRYFQMVERCYMSVLSSFTAEEIREGLAEMEHKYTDVTTLSFVDHFDYITGVKG
ncbi:MAG: methyltransferase domain-containing protein [Luteitalea sp.]|nr:methyltransferase domain-containing protein [Luteitalea sp.]